MTSRDFCYWCQGFFEIAEASDPGCRLALTPDQTSMIRRHLAMVFKHEIDPSFLAEQQAELNAIHMGATPDKTQTTIGGTGPDGTVYRC